MYEGSRFPAPVVNPPFNFPFVYRGWVLFGELLRCLNTTPGFTVVTNLQSQNSKLRKCLCWTFFLDGIPLLSVQREDLFWLPVTEQPFQRSKQGPGVAAAQVSKNNIGWCEVVNTWLHLAPTSYRYFWPHSFCLFVSALSSKVSAHHNQLQSQIC